MLKIIKSALTVSITGVVALGMYLLILGLNVVAITFFALMTYKMLF